LDQKLPFTYLFASIRTSEQQKEEVFSTLKKHPAIQNIQISTFFLFLWAIFALLDPDPDSESGNGSTDLIESESNPDPDPKHCVNEAMKDLSVQHSRDNIQRFKR
jgi:hypothetical protein